ncbi:hypothetical protein F2P81_009313 [Scophthalmus maximus]|uniref:Myosin motor domain-containing protein n=1 Tax=Scophthalmus maximus TaxID=52904 RepID=A0A6A4T1F8_SCOMX|nr:hypothetical protein F2P81_009313 [Scophthalmus maximus]
MILLRLNANAGQGSRNCSVETMTTIERARRRPSSAEEDRVKSSGGIEWIKRPLKKNIKEEKQPVATAVAPPPALSAVPGGFLKQLVRDSEKETKHKEPEVKEEKPPNKLSDNLVQQFLLPDQTPPILEAEMALRAEQLLSSSSSRQGCGATQSSGKSPTQRFIFTPEADGKHQTKREVTPEPPVVQQQQQQDARSEKASGRTPRAEPEEDRVGGVKQAELEDGMEERLEPEGRQADTAVTEHNRELTLTHAQRAYDITDRNRLHRGCGTGIPQLTLSSCRVLVSLSLSGIDVSASEFDGCSLISATQLKPDEGTPELPEGRVRVRLQTDGSLHDATEYEIEKCNPSELDLCEDLSDLQSVNECGVLHTLTSRAKANMPLTHAGPNLVNFWPPLQAHSKTPKSRRGESLWDAPPALAALVKRVYVSMVGTRRDHSVCAVGRSGTGKTTTCQTFTHALLKQAGTTGENISVGRRQFVNFDSAQAASSVLGCEGEELQTAVFKHHLRQLLQRATGGGRERSAAAEPDEGPRMTAAQCVEGMAAGLYEELFTAIVSLINRCMSDRALSAKQLTLASVMVVDTPGMRNPRHAAEERGAGWSELCHNYLQERLLEHHHTHTFRHTLERYAQEQIPVELECPESSPAEVVSAIDQAPPQVRAADGDPRGLLWVLDEEMVTPDSSESSALGRVCQYYGNTGTKARNARTNAESLPECVESAWT